MRSQKRKDDTGEADKQISSDLLFGNITDAEQEMLNLLLRTRVSMRPRKADSIWELCC